MTEPSMTLPNGETIREGEYGVTRDGQKVGPLFSNDNNHWPFLNAPPETDRAKLAWKSNGVGCRVMPHAVLDVSCDIIAKWHPVEAGPDPKPVKPPKRDLRTINEPFGELDERTQKRLRKAAKRGWPVRASGSNGIWILCTPTWLMGLKYRLDPTFTPPKKRATFWLTNGRVFQSAREAKTAYPGSDPVKVRECKK